MSFSNEWDYYVRAVNELSRARNNLRVDLLDDEIRSALSGGGDAGVALFLLYNSPPDRLSPFLDLLVKLALDSGAELEFVRHVLAHARREDAEPHLVLAVDDVIARGDEAWQEYRRLAELLDLLGFSALLDRLVENASRSDNVDIREIYEDFTGLPPP